MLEQFKNHAPLKYTHTKEVVSIVEKLLAGMEVSEQEKSVITLVAYYHNIGWMTFSKEFCAYEGKYTDPEFALMRTYPAEGAKILKKNNFAKDVIEGVELHANNFEQDLPLAARIVRFARDFRKVLELKDKFPTIKDALADMRFMAEQRKAYDPYLCDVAEKVYK